MSQPREDPLSATTSGDDELLAALADDFTARVRRGDRPKVEEYVSRHHGKAAGVA